MSLAVENTSTEEHFADAVKTSLAKIGITVNITPIDAANYFSTIDNMKNQYDLTWGDWIADWPNASTVLPVLFDGRQIKKLPQSNQDLAYLNDPAVNAQIDKIAKMTDIKRPNAAYGALDKQIVKDAAVVPLMYMNFSELSGSKVGGVIPDTILAEPSLVHVYIKTCHAPEVMPRRRPAPPAGHAPPIVTPSATIRRSTARGRRTGHQPGPSTNVSLSDPTPAGSGRHPAGDQRDHLLHLLRAAVRPRAAGLRQDLLADPADGDQALARPGQELSLSSTGSSSRACSSAATYGDQTSCDPLRRPPASGCPSRPTPRCCTTLLGAFPADLSLALGSAVVFLILGVGLGVARRGPQGQGGTTRSRSGRGPVRCVRAESTSSACC